MRYQLIHRSRYRLQLAVSISAFLLFSGSPSFAAWEIVPDVGTFIENNDNLRLRTEGSQDGSLTLVDARVRLTNRIERGLLWVEPRILTDRYADSENEDLESDDRYLRAAGNYNWQAVRAGFSTDFARQNIRRAEISDPFFPDIDVEDPAIDDGPVDVETGQLDGIDQNRETYRINSFLDFNISDRNSFRLDARKIDLSYSDFEVSGRTSFDDTTVGLGIIRRVDARNRVSARIFTSTYEAAENENVTDTFGVEGSFFRPLTETWTIRINAGVQRSDFIFRDRTTLDFVDNADSNILANLQFRRRTERSSVVVDFGRRANPNASGYVVIRDQLRLEATRRLTERVTGGIAFRASETTSLDDVNTNDDREFTRIQAYFDWAITPRLYMQVSVDHIRQQFVNATVERAKSNSIRLGIFYRGQPRL